MASGPITSWQIDGKYFLKIFIYLWVWVFLTVHGLLLVTESMSYSLVIVGRLLIEVISLVAEYRL